ncbi:HNH endonuclease signature motif containing protein [Microbacterium terricola]|uniref:HNH endonuclease n=1 Tax=Microbacterium terricola TaxID=344163 RepID=A0ABM8DXI6_9MICO|nr:HNH endonuclease signature motif containing protein [Microbacterium terricola]UYK38953.1 HNH endonuclease [Microbacterium terricola]BDV30347.1 HNH endonuclease [Microbacterium terricola]
MEDLIARLGELDTALSALVAEVFDSDLLGAATDPQILATMAAAARVSRHAEALLAAAAGHVDERSDRWLDRDQRLSSRMGCRSVAELVERVSLVAPQTANRYVKAGRAVIGRVDATSGERHPRYPGLYAALAAGFVGIDGVLAISGPLDELAPTVSAEARAAADDELGRAARGEGAGDAPPATAADLRQMALVWAMYLDPDGSEPREDRAERKRGLVFGHERNGLVPFHGHLLTEVAAQFRLLSDSMLNPKVDPAFTRGPWFCEDPDDAAAGSENTDADADGDPIAEPDADYTDPRTHPQKQHDVLATILAKVAGSGSVPSIGGAPPTLVVSVRQEDLESGRGHAFLQGVDAPQPLGLARHTGCVGAIQRVVFDRNDRIISLTTTDRVFTHHQRRAIYERDGGCIIPGCHVPPAWCEIHHVTEHSKGGPTSTCNGVPLCWHHHRTFEASGWQIRMNHGVPEIRGPVWWDPLQRWRCVTASPTRLVTRHERAHAGA